MLNNTEQATTSTLKPSFPFFVVPPTEDFRQAYEQNRHRIYALAFWMTDNELAAEELMIATFRRAFTAQSWILPEIIDEAFIQELRKIMNLGRLTLKCASADNVMSVRHNIRRIDLEQAVIQLPATEKLVFLMHDVERYTHDRISALLGLTESQSRVALHQARLRMRELLAR